MRTKLGIHPRAGPLSGSPCNYTRHDSRATVTSDSLGTLARTKGVQVPLETSQMRNPSMRDVNTTVASETLLHSKVIWISSTGKKVFLSDENPVLRWLRKRLQAEFIGAVQVLRIVAKWISDFMLNPSKWIQYPFVTISSTEGTARLRRMGRVQYCTHKNDAVFHQQVFLSQVEG